jgi:hypothetical protein
MRCKPQSRKYFLGIEVIQANAGSELQVFGHKGFALRKAKSCVGLSATVLVGFSRGRLSPEDIGCHFGWK